MRNLMRRAIIRMGAFALRRGIDPGEMLTLLNKDLKGHWTLVEIEAMFDAMIDRNAIISRNSQNQE